MYELFPNGPVWRRHIDQLHPRYYSAEDNDPTDDPKQPANTPPVDTNTSNSTSRPRAYRNPRAPTLTADNYGLSNSRRSKRLKPYTFDLHQFGGKVY